MKSHVKKYRQLNEMTQTELGAAIGVSRQTIHAIEAGKYVPSTILALKIARLFQNQVSELFMLEEED